MQAAVKLANSPVLKIVNDYEIPKPTSKQVLLKVQASGVCHSDVYILSQAPDDPRSYIMGHEITGIASELGDDVDKDKIKTGERYSVLSIGGCISCIAKSKGIPPSEDPGTEFLQLPFLGIGANGGHAEYVVVDADLLVPVPGNVLPEHAAVMADAGITAWHAIKTTASIKKGEKVLITGIGGLGLLAIQFAVYLGAEVYAVDMRPSSRKLALEFGAKKAFSLPELDEALNSREGFSVDCAVDFVSTSITLSKEVSALSKVALNTNLKRNGRLVVVGISDESIILPVFTTIAAKLSVHSSLYGDKEDLVEVLDLVSKGHIKPVVEKAPLGLANEAYNELRANLIPSRKVLIPPSFWKD